MDSQKKHLRHIMLYCFKKDDSPNDTTEICTVYGNGTTITILSIHNWFKRFKAGSFDLKNEGHPAATRFYQGQIR